MDQHFVDKKFFKAKIGLFNLKFRFFLDLKLILPKNCPKRRAATGWFLTACTHDFLFFGYAGKFLVPITAFLQFPPRNLNARMLPESRVWIRYRGRVIAGVKANFKKFPYQ